MSKLIIRTIIVIVLGFMLFLDTNDNLGVIYRTLTAVAFSGQFILLYDNCKTYIRQKNDKKNPE